MVLKFHVSKEAAMGVADSAIFRVLTLCGWCQLVSRTHLICCLLS